MRILAVVLVVGCGSAVPSRPAAAHSEAPPAAERQIFRHLRVGTRPIAMRTTFALVIDGSRASLTETDEREHGALALAEADRGARWEVVARRSYRGGATVTSGAIELALASDGVQPLQLRCTRRAVDAAAAGAIRVPSPDRPGDYTCGDRGVWQPPATSSVAALVCDAGVADPDDDDDDRLVFAPPPGLEYVSVDDACALRGGGLRIAR
jgi:hypothetical protein